MCYGSDGTAYSIECVRILLCRLSQSCSVGLFSHSDKVVAARLAYTRIDTQRIVPVNVLAGEAIHYVHERVHRNTHSVVHIVADHGSNLLHGALH